MKRVLIGVVATLCLLVAAAVAYRHFALVVPLREQATAKLHDPDSASFRNERLSSDWTLKGSLLCGEVNAKNLMGAYAGYRWFESDGDGYANIESDVLREILDKRGERRCASTPHPWWWLNF